MGCLVSEQSRGELRSFRKVGVLRHYLGRQTVLTIFICSRSCLFIFSLGGGVSISSIQRKALLSRRQQALSESPFFDEAIEEDCDRFWSISVGRLDRGVNSITMAVRTPATLLLLAFASVNFAMAYFSWASAASVEPSRGLHSRRALYQTDRIEPRRSPGRAHTFFSKVAAYRAGELNDRDYGPPSSNPPVHDEPPLDTFNSVYDSFHQLDISPGADIHADYAPATTHPPDDPDYPPGNHPPRIDSDYPPGNYPSEKTWSSEASFMHATLPPPTIVDHPENLSGN